MDRSLAAAIALALVAAPAHGGEPYLVRNINREPAEPVFGPGEPTKILSAAGPRVLFYASEAGHEGLWATDGTAAGTRRLADHDPRLAVTPEPVFSTPGRLFFNVEGRLWASDGTRGGTHQLTFPPVHEQTARFALGRLATGEVLFGGDRDTLWATDGTPAGTRWLADVRPFERSRPGSSPVVEGGFLFAARRIVDEDLWVTDGTPQGTRLAVDLDAEGAGSPEHLTPVGDGLVAFFAFSDVHGKEPWVTDGTPAGTRLLADVTPGAGSSDVPAGFHAAGDLLYFAVADDGESALWRTDGTPAGTFRLPMGGDATPFSPDFFRPAALGDLLVFPGGDTAHGVEPWVTDGTGAGTRLLADLCPGSCWSQPDPLTPTSLGVTFGAAVPGGRRALWLTDGTGAGTRVLFDRCPPDCDSGPRLLGDLGGLLVVRSEAGDDAELWAIDAAPGAVRLPDRTWAALPSFPEVAAVAGGRLFLLADDGVHGLEPWVTDGTPAGTVLLRDLAIGAGDADSFPRELVALGDEAFFFADDGSDEGLWATDGTEAGTRRVRALLPPRSKELFGNLSTLVERDGDLYFLLSRDPHDQAALWRSDGTGPGTLELLLPDVPEPVATTLVVGDDEVFLAGPGLWRAGRSPGSGRRLTDARVRIHSNLRAAGRRLFFSATDDPSGQSDLELWVSDGTAGGTRRVIDLAPGEASSLPILSVVFRGEIYFSAEVPGEGRSLWVSDGTAGGTRRAELPGAADEVTILGVVGGRMLFTTRDFEPPFGPRRLVATDGTPGGTAVLSDPYLSERAVLTADRAFFFYQDRILRTDGTVGGTHATAGWRPQASEIVAVTATGGRLVVVVRNLYLERELWISDGTAAGTRRVTVTSSASGAAPPASIVVGGRVLYSDDADDRGREPWAADLSLFGPAGPPAAPRELTAEPVSSSAVRLQWQDVAGDESEYLVFSRWPLSGVAAAVARLPADSEGVVVSGLLPDLPMTFQVAALNVVGRSGLSEEVGATPLPADPGPCSSSDRSLCLQGDRFEVRVRWWDHHNSQSGFGHAEAFPDSERTGRFWFFDSDNVELIVKQLDGRGINGAFWTFYGALSDVAYWITVTDTVERRNRTYYNPPGTICGRGDTGAFPEPVPGAAPAAPRSPAGALAEIDLSAVLRTASAEISRPVEPRAESGSAESGNGPGSSAARPAGVRSAPAAAPAPGAGGTCVPTAEVLCLHGGRYRVEVTWHDQHNGGDGVGRAVPGTPESGYFWFFSADNVELVVKILDATPVNGHVWVFYGALSDVEYTIEVTDTLTGLSRSYANPPGNLCGGADLSAF